MDLLELLSMRLCIYISNKEFLFGKELLDLFTNGLKINIIWIINSLFYKQCREIGITHLERLLKLQKMTNNPSLEVIKTVKIFGIEKITENIEYHQQYSPETTQDLINNKITIINGCQDFYNKFLLKQQITLESFRKLKFI